jgi:hypothetical protein
MAYVMREISFGVVRMVLSSSDRSKEVAGLYGPLYKAICYHRGMEQVIRKVLPESYHKTRVCNVLIQKKAMHKDTRPMSVD